MKRYHDMGGDDTDNEVEEIVSEEVMETFHINKYTSHYKRHKLFRISSSTTFMWGCFFGGMGGIFR